MSIIFCYLSIKSRFKFMLNVVEVKKLFDLIVFILLFFQTNVQLAFNFSSSSLYLTSSFFSCSHFGILKCYFCGTWLGEFREFRWEWKLLGFPMLPTLNFLRKFQIHSFIVLNKEKWATKIHSILKKDPKTFLPAP